MIQAKVKWNKQKLDVELNPAESVADFKAALFSLTGVPVSPPPSVVVGSS